MINCSMVICKDIDDADQYTTRWGNMCFELSRDDIMALLEGKILADPNPDEYGVFIKMEETSNE